METLKTSYEWDKEQSQFIILDPDGWDRENFGFSFHEEKITKDEFNKRLIESTLMGRFVES